MSDSDLTQDRVEEQMPLAADLAPAAEPELHPKVVSCEMLVGQRMLDDYTASALQSYRVASDDALYKAIAADEAGRLRHIYRRRPRSLRVRVFFAWYDLWVGAYWSASSRALYICPLPCVCVRVSWSHWPSDLPEDDE